MCSAGLASGLYSVKPFLIPVCNIMAMMKILLACDVMAILNFLTVITFKGDQTASTEHVNSVPVSIMCLTCIRARLILIVCFNCKLQCYP